MTRRPNDPMNIDLAAPNTLCIAHASTESDGRPRWSALSVYHLPDGRWVAQSQGFSSLDGERTKTRRLVSTNLERALKLFDESDLGIVVSETAREWAEKSDFVKARTVPWTDQEALDVLYGVGLEGAKGRGSKGYAGMVADDFGVNESTARAAIANGTPIKVPLAAVMPFLDLKALAAVRESRNG